MTYNESCACSHAALCLQPKSVLENTLLSQDLKGSYFSFPLNVERSPPKHVRGLVRKERQQQTASPGLGYLPK